MLQVYSLIVLFKLVAMHIQGGGQLDRNYNVGVSVKHIEFVRAYLVNVLPHLQKNLWALRLLLPLWRNFRCVTL